MQCTDTYLFIFWQSVSFLHSRPIVSFKLLGQLVILDSIFLDDPSHWSRCIRGPKDFLKTNPARMNC